MRSSAQLVYERAILVERCDSLFGAFRRSRKMSWGPRVVCWAGLLIVSLSGCKQQPSPVLNKTDPCQERLLLLGQTYRQFNRDNHRPPRSAADLLPLLQKRGATKEALDSTRDGQPFVVAWGLDITVPPAGKGRPVLAYEQQGLSQSRYVLSTMGNVELLQDQPFRESSFAPGFQPK
jgi:hypothetical protein